MVGLMVPFQRVININFNVVVRIRPPLAKELTSKSDHSFQNVLHVDPDERSVNGHYNHWHSYNAF